MRVLRAFVLYILVTIGNTIQGVPSVALSMYTPTRYSLRKPFYKRHPIITGIAALITIRWLLNPHYPSKNIVTAISLITIAYVLGILIQEHGHVRSPVAGSTP